MQSGVANCRRGSLHEERDHAMTDEELTDAIDGLWAWWSGCRSSGVNDEALKARVREAILAEGGMARASRLIFGTFFSPKSIGDGYGLKDARSLLTWLEEDMGIEV